MPAALVAVISLSAFAYTALSLPRNVAFSEVTGDLPEWQTNCALSPEATPSVAGEPTIELLGQAAPDAHSMTLVSAADGELRAWDHANERQWVISGDGFEPVDDIVCEKFRAYGWVFDHTLNTLRACRGARCAEIAIMPNTRPFTYAAANGSVFAGTNYGDALVFRAGRWCRMTRTGDTYRCVFPRPVVTEPSNQFYSSVHYAGRTLIGDYPSGKIFEFDGDRLFPSDLTPPTYEEGMPLGGAESQSLAVYCGDLYVGYWPYGELWRYDGAEWHGPTRLFSGPEKTDGSPFRAQAENDGLIFNAYGQRVSALIVHQGALYASTSDKGWWPSGMASSVPQDAKEEYGRIFKITKPGCVAG